MIMVDFSGRAQLAAFPPGSTGMTVTVIGCDGSPLTPAAARALAGASVVAGARRQLACGQRAAGGRASS